MALNRWRTVSLIGIIGLALACPAFGEWLINPQVISPEGALFNPSGPCQGGYLFEPGSVSVLNHDGTSSIQAQEPTQLRTSSIVLGDTAYVMERSTVGSTVTLSDTNVADGQWFDPSTGTPRIQVLRLTPWYRHPGANVMGTRYDASYELREPPKLCRESSAGAQGKPDDQFTDNDVFWYYQPGRRK